MAVSKPASALLLHLSLHLPLHLPLQGHRNPSTYSTTRRGGGRQWAAVGPLLSENPQGLTDTTWAVAGHLFALARGSYY